MQLVSMDEASKAQRLRQYGKLPRMLAMWLT